MPGLLDFPAGRLYNNRRSRTVRAVPLPPAVAPERNRSDTPHVGQATICGASAAGAAAPGVSSFPSLSASSAASFGRCSGSWAAQSPSSSISGSGTFSRRRVRAKSAPGAVSSLPVSIW